MTSTNQTLAQVLENRLREWRPELERLVEHFRLVGEKQNFDRALELSKNIRDAETELKKLRGD